MKAIRLKTDYLTNPIGIDNVTPELMWNCEGGKLQTAYRIVCRDEAGGILWDSKKTNSASMRVTYAGEVLTSRACVTWSVQLWDETDVPGDVSEACFEIGLLNGSDWNAKWITGNYKVIKKKRYPVDCFKKQFEIPDISKIAKGRAYMTACGIYEGRLNGAKIGDHCLAPGITDYRMRVQYQTVDITDQLKQGTNELLFMLADGWYRGSVGAWGMKNYYGKETKLLAQIEITSLDGSVRIISTDDSFSWTDEGPIRFADNKDGEIYDARFDDLSKADWRACKVTDHKVIPTASGNFAVKEKERFTDPGLIITPSGKRVLDFGQNIAGIAEFTVMARAGQRLFLRFGELIKDGEFTQKNIQCVRGQYRTPLQQVEYFCKEGFNHYKTRFAIFGFQYIEVEGDCDWKPEDFTAIAVYSDFKTTFRFESSNRLLDRYVKNTLWSLKNNSADLPTDCPTRERHGWTGDAQVFFNTASYMVNYAPFAKKFENDMCDWQKKSGDGNFPQIAPEGGTDSYMRFMNGSVGWSDAGVLIPYRIWKKYGDKAVIAKYYDNMRAYAGFMIARSRKTMPFISEKTGLSRKDRKYIYNCGQHYGEWAEPDDIHQMTWKDFVSSQPEVATAYFSYVMSVMKEVAEALGQSGDAGLYREYADGARLAYQKLVSLKKYTLDTGRQAKLVRPLYFNLLSKEQTAYARKRLIQALDDYGWRVGTGFLSTPFILYVLADIDIEFAYKLLENEERPGWLSMPKEGATTIWEDWNGPDSNNGTGGGIASLNHYSKGAVCEWVFERMCGIKVSGENEFVIEPNPGGHFEFARFEYDSIYGTVACGWKRKAEGKYEYEILIPPNTKALVRLGKDKEFSLSAGRHIQPLN